MSRALWISVLFLSSTAGAGPKTLSVAAGACRDTDLVQAQAAFSAALAEQLHEDAIDARALLSAARPHAGPSLEELSRSMEAAQTRFYGGQPDSAAQQVKEVIDDLQKAAPSPRAWSLLSRAWVLQSLIFRAANKKEPANDAFRRVLKVAPDFALTTGDYSPSTVAAFEAVRKELKASKRVRLTVSSQPPGADVFLDGAPVGKTPFSGAVSAGAYSVQVTDGTRVSFARQVKLEREVAVQVDLGFEGSLAAQLPLCVEGSGDEAVSRASKLGAWAGAGRVVVLRLAPREQQADWLEAVLLDVGSGTRVRSGGMKLVGSRQAGSLEALARFILTGQGTGPWVSSAEAPDVAGVKPAPALEGTPTRPVETAPAAPFSAPVEATQVSAAPSLRGSGPRVFGVVLLGVGLAAGASSVAVYAVGLEDRGLLVALKDPQGQLPPPGAQGRAEALALQPKVDGNTAATVALAVSGGVVALTGAMLAVFLPPQDAQVSVAVTPSGAAISLSARF